MCEEGNKEFVGSEDTIGVFLHELRSLCRAQSSMESSCVCLSEQWRGQRFQGRKKRNREQEGLVWSAGESYPVARQETDSASVRRCLGRRDDC